MSARTDASVDRTRRYRTISAARRAGVTDASVLEVIAAIGPNPDVDELARAFDPYVPTSDAPEPPFAISATGARCVPSSLGDVALPPPGTTSTTTSGGPHGPGVSAAHTPGHSRRVVPPGAPRDLISSHHFGGAAATLKTGPTCSRGLAVDCLSEATS